MIEEILPDVEAKGKYVHTRMQAHSRVAEVRQIGLMIALDLAMDRKSFDKLLRNAPDSGLLLLTAGRNTTIRLLPPLTISFSELAHACTQLEKLIDNVA